MTPWPLTPFALWDRKPWKGRHSCSRFYCLRSNCSWNLEKLLEFLFHQFCKEILENTFPVCLCIKMWRHNIKSPELKILQNAYKVLPRLNSIKMNFWGKTTSFRVPFPIPPKSKFKVGKAVYKSHGLLLSLIQIQEGSSLTIFSEKLTRTSHCDGKIPTFPI